MPTYTIVSNNPCPAEGQTLLRPYLHKAFSALRSDLVKPQMAWI